jgi:dienelactone hydrolase
MKNLPRLVLNRIAVGVLGLCAGRGCASARDGPHPAFSVAQRHFSSGGMKILVDVYTPKGPLRGPHPPVLVLHGAGGMLFDGPEMSRVAQDLATAGFEAYQVHYFNRTSTWFARQPVLLVLFPTWRETVHDAVEWVRTLHPEARSVGIFGYSLGAFAAVEEARRNSAVGAVVAQAGGFWHAQPEGPTRQPMPPMLIIQGLKDQRVPFAKYTQPLLAFLRARHDSVATRFYPAEGHDFRAAARAPVRAQAVAFFRQHLANAGE